MMLGIAASNSVRKARGPRRNAGAHLSKEDGDADGQRNRKQQRQKRRNQRAVNEGNGAEVAVDRIPILGLAGDGVFRSGVEEFQPRLRPVELCLVNELIGDKRDNDEDAERAQ